MADSLARVQLARAARHLGRSCRRVAPSLVFVTDDERQSDAESAIAALPRGCLIIVRSRTQSRRAALAGFVGRIARRSGHTWLVADDAPLAARTGAHGVHFPERKLAQAQRWRVRRPEWFITCAAHSLQACLRARTSGVDAVLLSPVFATASHPTRPPLGSLRTRLISRTVAVPIYALGGIDFRTARRLQGAPLAGLAAIAGLDPDGAAGSGRCACAMTTV